MPKPRRVEMAPARRPVTIIDRLEAAERRVKVLEALADEQVTVIDALVTAHNAAAAQVQEMMYRVTYTMQRITVKKAGSASGIITGQPDRTATLYEFYLEDRDAFVSKLEASQRAVRENLAADARAAAAGADGNGHGPEEVTGDQLSLDAIEQDAAARRRAH